MCGVYEEESSPDSRNLLTSLVSRMWKYIKMAIMTTASIPNSRARTDMAREAVAMPLTPPSSAISVASTTLGAERGGEVCIAHHEIHNLPYTGQIHTLPYIVHQQIHTFSHISECEQIYIFPIESALEQRVTY